MRIWEWLGDNWLALAAILIAAGSLFNSWRAEKRNEDRRQEDRAVIEEERRQRAVAFDLEFTGRQGDEDCFTLWYTGKEECEFTLDLAELARWAVDDVGLQRRGHPDRSGGTLRIRPDRYLGLPETVTINITRPFQATRVVRVPRARQTKNLPTAPHDGGGGSEQTRGT